MYAYISISVWHYLQHTGLLSYSRYIIEFSYQNHEKNPALFVPDLLNRATGVGQITTVLSREIHWLFLHRVRQGTSTPEGSPGLLAPAHMRSVPRNQRTGEAEEVAIETGESPGIPGQGEPPCQVSAQQAGTPSGVLACQGTAQLWGVSAFEQEKAKE